MTPYEQSRQLLATYQEAIAKLGYETRLFPAGEVMAYPLLLVGIEKDSHGRDRTVNLMLLPFEAGEAFQHLNLVQLYAPLPFSAPPLRRRKVEKLLLTINNRTTLGHFGLTENGDIFLRYVWSIGTIAPPAPETIQQLILLFIHLQNTFSADIEAAAGE